MKTKSVIDSDIEVFSKAMKEKWVRGTKAYGEVVIKDIYSEAKEECVDLANYSMVLYKRLLKLETIFSLPKAGPYLEEVFKNSLDLDKPGLENLSSSILEDFSKKLTRKSVIKLGSLLLLVYCSLEADENAETYK